MTDTEYAGFTAMCAHRALLYEVLAAPKPGLVDRFDSGAHEDMDVFTFVDSVEALIPYFYRCTLAGIRHGEPDASLFSLLREYGLEAEGKMYEATGGVNTHKGAILSFGLICGAAGLLGRGASAEDICLTAGRIGAPLMDDFRRIDPEGATNGERQYLAAGRTGIRGEAVSGFASVRCVALPVLWESLEKGMSLNDSALRVLMALIAGTEDTALIKRCGDRDVNVYRAEAAEALESEDLKSRLAGLNEKWSKEGISAGGCADLLAISLFFAFLEGKK